MTHLPTATKGREGRRPTREKESEQVRVGWEGSQLELGDMPQLSRNPRPSLLGLSWEKGNTTVLLHHSARSRPIGVTYGQ